MVDRTVVRKGQDIIGGELQRIQLLTQIGPRNHIW